MPTGHNHWRRLVRRTMEEMMATAEIAKYTTWLEAVHVFFVKAEIQLINRQIHRETSAVTRRLMKKHRIMRRYVDAVMGDLSESEPVLPEHGPELQNRIWLCWWQGYDQAPEISKRCMDSIRQHSGGHTVTIITEENYQEYVRIPQWLEEKYRTGVISRTHFSDVLRLSLLAEYGGLWLDATIFCSSEKVQDCFRQPLWSVKRPGYGHISAGCGGFVTGMMRCDSSLRWIYVLLRDTLLEYWKRHDILIDYLILDYLIDYVIRNNSAVRQCFNAILPNNPQSDELVKILNQPYDEAIWNEMTKETYLFILSWKQNYVMEADGRETFYAKLIKGEL